MPSQIEFDPEKSAIRHGIFVSDLHLFSPRSAGQHYRQQLVDLSHGVDCIVLGGDIFDFRWSDLGGLSPSIDAAERWLEELQAKVACDWIVFLPGNHDCHPEFLQRLDRLAARSQKFVWADHHLQIEDTLFLHGDLLDAGGVKKLEHYRSKFHHDQPQPQWAHQGYEVAVGMRIHKLVPLLRHRPRLTCGRLLTSLDELTSESNTQVRQLYFGHTHVPIRQLRIGDIDFYNPGAALRHMSPELLRFDINQTRS